MTGRAWTILLLVIVLALAGGAGFIRCEGEPPAITAPDELALGRAGNEVTVSAADPGSGVKRIRVSLRHANGELAILEEEFPGNPIMGASLGREIEPIVVKLDAKEQGLAEGAAFLIVEVTDWSWASLLRGNTATREIPIEIDLTPPRVSVESGLTYIQRGGSGAVVYRLTEPTLRHGVQVGKAFFAGAPLPGGRDGQQIALFAVPREAKGDVPIRVFAEDWAGNRSERSWSTRLKERRFDDVRINLSSRFMNNKVPDLATALRVDDSDRVAAFQHINQQTRAENEAKIREIVSGSGNEFFASGAFLQMRNSAVTSRFAEHRSYFLEGKQISEAIHYGYDLASTARAPIEASNAGRVLYADDLGIYGSCVVLDHGLGLTSLYAHLSQIDVGVGDTVERGNRLGLSGATGLAGGDHLHFAILVGSTYVDPKEWWDGKWVREHLDVALAAATPLEEPEALEASP